MRHDCAYNGTHYYKNTCNVQIRRIYINGSFAFMTKNSGDDVAGDDRFTFIVVWIDVP